MYWDGANRIVSPRLLMRHFTRMFLLIGMLVSLTRPALPGQGQGDPESASQGQDVIDFNTAHLGKRIPAKRAQAPIVIDGVLDEADWQDAPEAVGFIQNEPNEGQPPTYPSEVRILYDENNLYFGVMAYDDEPDKLIITDLTRDYNTRSVDSFGIILDTFHDRRNSYMFQTNPASAKFDGQSFNEGQSFDRNWDGVWFVKSRVVDNGWIAEVAIPFKTVKFRDLSDQTWGLQLMRRNRRLNEDSFWSPIPRIHRGTRVSLAGTLDDFQDLQPGANVKVTPYVRGDVEQLQTVDETLQDATAGIDAKIGIGTGLTLDLTVNTDFSQVEADVQQVNLTRFDIFFPEKRDFFLENSGIFRFGPPENARRRSFQGSFGLAATSGLGGGQSRGDDLLLFFSRRIGLTEDGEQVPVVAGARLTGRLGPYEMGFLNIQTREKEFVSPGDNFTVMRVKKNILFNSDVGVMFINKATMQSDHYNRSFGADANIRLNPQMDLNGYIAATQSPFREGSDMAGRIAYSYNGETIQGAAAYSSIDENFNPEVGFAPRIGVKRASAELGYRYRQSWGRSFLREINPRVEFDNFTGPVGDVVSRYLNFRLTFRMQSGGFLNIGRNQNIEQPDEDFEIVPDVIIPPGFYEFNDTFVMLFTDPSKTLSGGGRVSSGDFYSGTKRSFTLGGVLRIAPRLTLEGAWSYNDIDLIEGAFTTHLVTARAVYTFSTTMFLNALIQYNSIDQEWSSNFRFNFIHHPLSNFFIVYNELRSPAGLRSDRSLIAKFTYLFNF